MDEFLSTCITPETLLTFARTHVTADHWRDAVCACVRTQVERALLDGLKRGRFNTSVLQLRDAAETVWRDTVAAEYGLPPSGLDSSRLVARLRDEGKRTDGEARVKAVVEVLAETAREAYRFVDRIDAVPRPVLLRAVAAVLRAWEERITSGAYIHEVAAFTPVCPVSAVNVGSAAYQSPWSTPVETMRAVAARLRPSDAPLNSASIRHLMQDLGVKSVTGALVFAFHVHADDWEDVFCAPPHKFIYGPPARLREARPPSSSSTPHWAKPKGGALPPPNQFVYTVGTGKDGYIGLAGCELAKGGGLLASLPGLCGTKANGCHYAWYWRVLLDTNIASVIEIAETPDGTIVATTKVAFELEVPGADGNEEDDEDAEEPPAPDTIDWIDAQRDFENNLVLCWGARNPATGGVKWVFYMGLRDEWRAGQDPFTEVAAEDVDDMFAARLENGEAIDFRDHGNLLTAEVTHVFESTTRGRFVSPVTRVVHHETVVSHLPGVQATAVWGTPHTFVVWTRDQRGATVSTVDDAADRTSFNASVAPVPAVATAIAPWWWDVSM